MRNWGRGASLNRSQKCEPSFSKEQTTRPTACGLGFCTCKPPGQLEPNPPRRPRPPLLAPYRDTRNQEHPAQESPGERNLMGPNFTLEPRQQIRPRSRGTRSRSLLLESFCLIHQILEPFLISVFAPHAKMPRRGDFASLTRVIEIMLYLADELIQRRESLDLPSDRKVPIQIFGWLGQQKTAPARHLEYTSLDLPASSWNPAVPDDAGVPKIQTDHGITYDLWYSLSRDCTARPTMTEACDPYPAGAQGVNPRRTVPVIRPDERNGVSILFRSIRFLERRGARSPLGLHDVSQSITPRRHHRPVASGRVDIEVRCQIVRKLAVLPGIVRGPVYKRGIQPELQNVQRLRPNLVMHQDK